MESQKLHTQRYNSFLNHVIDWWVSLSTEHFSAGLGSLQLDYAVGRFHASNDFLNAHGKNRRLLAGWTEWLILIKIDVAPLE